MTTSEDISSSFRDPSGFVFVRNGVIHRQVNQNYQEHYDHLVGSGLYQSLADSGLLIPHDEGDIGFARTETAYKVIRPELVPFVSYPYEWSFSQLKDAALATLEIEKRALQFGMTLKDSSSYNIQFLRGKPVLIDTLSFEKYREGKPWVAYRQFCQHFLCPLALMSHVDVRLNQLLRVYIDGVPLDLANSVLPFRTRLSFSLLCHVHLHAGSQKYFGHRILNTNGHRMSRRALRGLIDSLESAVQKLTWRPAGTEWVNYYEDTNYSQESFNHKKELVSEFLDKSNPKSVWDLGANTALFSRIASRKGIQTISFDIDPAAVEKAYVGFVKEGDSNLLPLILDLTNPSPDLGWGNTERKGFLARGPADMVLALALIHHLAIGNNVPLSRLASFFARICDSLVIEFVPKSDSQIQRMLSTRQDVFTDYQPEKFEEAFRKHFAIEACAKIRSTERSLYLMHKR